MSKATKETTCFICKDNIYLGEDVSWSRRGEPKQWHLKCKGVSPKESSFTEKPTSKLGVKLLVKAIEGMSGPRELNISKTKNFEGKDCLKGHGIKRNEPFVRISNSFGASDSLICLEHSRERGYVL